MTQQALHSAQARLDKLQTAYDEAFSALEANPSSGLKRERFEELKISLHKAEDSVNSLAKTASTSGRHLWLAFPSTNNFAHCCMK